MNIFLGQRTERERVVSKLLEISNNEINFDKEGLSSITVDIIIEFTYGL